MSAQPEIAQQTISTYEQAAAANRGTACRQGNVIVLGGEAADEVLVGADLHGNRLNFDRLVAVAALDEHPGRHLVMQEVCHGGPLYPATAACMSHLLLEDVARLKMQYPERFHFLLSNHELAELTDFPITKANRLLNLAFRSGLQEMYRGAADRVRSAALRFIESCPLAVRLANGVFVCHSAPENVDRDGFDADVFDRPLGYEDFDPQGPVFRLVWGRDFREENARAFADLVQARVLVHGHEPCAEGFQVPNAYQIILDCCGRNACFLLSPTNQPLTQQMLVERIRRL